MSEEKNNIIINYKEEMIYKQRGDIKIICYGKVNNIDFKIKSLGSYPTAYIKVPKDSIFYNICYDEIPIDIHGGLTYGEIEENEFWIGWDYAHYGDYTFNSIFNNGNEVKYNVDSILVDVKSAVNQLNTLLKIENSNEFKNNIRDYKINLIKIIKRFRDEQN